MALTTLLGFAAIAFTLIVVPGPDWAYVLAASARDHVVIPVVAGIAAGYTLVTLVVVAGVGTLVANVSFALTALTIAGASYLAYLGTRTLRSSTHTAPSAKSSAPLASTPLRYLTRGIGVSALNPKGLLVFLSILPQFASATAAWPLPAQLGVLGAVFILIAAAVYLAVGYTANRVFNARPSIARATNKVAGVAMIVVGVALLAERIVHTAI
ncbi:MAG TPA: LysE family translocator [Acidimicrobiales bacterium]|nr:LysE family translocator [Acidimicrobiales bacterium]